MRRIAFAGVVICAAVVGALGATATRAHAQVTGHEALAFCNDGAGSINVTGTGFSPALNSEGPNLWIGDVGMSAGMITLAGTGGFSATIVIDAGGGFTASFPAPDFLPPNSIIANAAVADGTFNAIYGPVLAGTIGPCSNAGGAGIASQVVLTELGPTLVLIPITINGALADSNGDPVHKAGVVITFTDGTNNLTCTTDASGTCEVAFTETSTAGVHFDANIPGGTGTFGGSLQIAALGATFSSIAAAPSSPTIVFGNGSSFSTITVTVVDGGGNGVPGGVVKLSTTVGSFAGCTSSCSANDNGNGTYSAALTATTGGVAAVTGTIGGSPVPGSASVTFTAPLVPPTILTGPLGLTNSPTGTFTFTGVPGASFQCSLDGGSYGSCSSPFPTGVLSDGAHTFSVKEGDATHPVSAPATLSWTIDTAAPTVSFTSTPPSSTASTSAAFAYTAAADTSSVACKLDGVPVTCTSTSAALTGLAPGPHTFQVVATDAAGNVGPATSYPWTINGPYAAPLIVTHPTTLTNTTTGTFTFTGAPGSPVFQCSVDGSAYAACTSAFTTGTLLDGVHTFAVIQQGDATHLASAPASFSWTVDHTPPGTPVFTSVPSNPTTSTLAVFTYTADPGAIVMCILDGTPVTCSSTGVTLSLLGVGTHTFQVYATDAASNTSQPASYTWTINSSGGCPNGAGDVNGGLNVKGGLQINAEVDCDGADKKHPTAYLHHAHIHVDGLGLKIDADTNSDNGKKGDVTGVSFTRNGDGTTTAVITGTWNGKPFTLTITDAGQKPKAQDTFRFVYGGFDSGLVTMPHGNAHVELGDHDE